MLTLSIRSTLMGSLENQHTVPLQYPDKQGRIASSFRLLLAPRLLHPSSHFHLHSAGAPSHLNESPLLRGLCQEGLRSIPFCGVHVCPTGHTHVGAWRSPALIRFQTAEPPPPRLPNYSPKACLPWFEVRREQLLPLPRGVWVGGKAG